MESVSEKVAFVTGSASGIGFCMVKELLKNGAKGVAIIDICEETGENAFKDISQTFGADKVIFIRTDTTKKEELEEAFEKTIGFYKQLDIVINNAGIVDEIDWKHTVGVNFVAVVEGSYLAMQKYLPQYQSGEEGIIINTASILGLSTMQTLPMYCSTKHAVVALGQCLGSEEFYKKYKVRVLTICPGVARTPLVENRDDSKLLFPDKFYDELSALNTVVQPPERVAKTLIEVIRNGKNGSLWVVEEDEAAYEVAVPHRRTMVVR